MKDFWAVSYSLIGTLCSRDYMQGGKFKNPIMAEDKVVIITGANTGERTFKF